MSDLMTDSDLTAQDLANLRRHWGSAYVIAYFARPGLWLAQRRDTNETVKADSPEALRRLIRLDYAARPVPRTHHGRNR